MRGAWLLVTGYQLSGIGNFSLRYLDYPEFASIVIVAMASGLCRVRTLGLSTYLLVVVLFGNDVRMHTPSATPSAEIDAEDLATTFAAQAAMDAGTTGEYIREIDRTSSTLEQGGGVLQDVAKELKRNADEVRQAVNGSLNIQVDAGMEPGVNGYTYIGGTDSDITLNADLLYAYDTTQKLEETIDHEQRHNEQVSLDTGGKETIFITDGGERVTDPTLFYEGDTEMHTAETFGRRTDQPKEYADGHDMANHIVSTHENDWHDTLTATGDLATLQGHVWEAGLKDGSLTMDELIHQAEETGYTNQAADVLSRYVQQAS